MRFGVLGQRRADTERFNPECGPTIARLLLDRGPAAIAGFVIPVVVYALDGIIRPRGFPHVGEKILEA